MEIIYYNAGIGSKCYYRQDLYCARVRNVFTDGTFSTLGSSLLVAAFFIFLCIVPRCCCIVGVVLSLHTTHYKNIFYVFG